jgi:Na+/glutamate symporter
MGQIGWMLSLIPDSIFVWIYYLLTILGVSLYIGSKLVKWIPMMGQYKLPAELVGVVLLVTGAFLFGGYGVQSAWEARVKELQDKLKIAEEKSQQVNTVIQTKVVERIKVVEKKIEVVKKEIEIQKEVINAECKINDVAIDLYNKAVSDPTEVKK